MAMIEECKEKLYHEDHGGLSFVRVSVSEELLADDAALSMLIRQELSAYGPIILRVIPKDVA